VLFHSFTQTDVEIEDKNCITTPFKKRSFVKPTELGDKLAQANVILCYLNFLDDLIDEKSLGKRLALATIKKPYKKAKKLFPEMDAALTGCYQKLRELEKENCKIFDRVCDPFAKLSETFCALMLGERADGYILDLCYNLGKWVYLIDALDDLERDFKRKNYNPFIYCFGDYKSAKQFVEAHYGDLQFVFYSVLNKIAENYNDLNLERYVCVLNNVLHKSIREKTEKVFEKYKEKK